MAVTLAPLTVVPFAPEHVTALGLVIQPPVTKALTIVDGQGVLCCFGISSPWPGLGMAWCEERDPLSMQAHGRRVGLAIHRAWRQWLAEGQYRRIECHHPQTHDASRRLVQSLGFTNPTVKPAYLRDGGTAVAWEFYPGEA